MIQYSEIDIIKVQQNAMIIHGVNTLGKMGAGIAKSIKERFPHVYADYARRCAAQRYNGELLGSINIYGEEDVHVCNMFTQKTIGRTGRHADPEAIKRCFDTLGFYIKSTNPDFQIFMPKLGCSLGGLDWETDVKWILEEFDSEYFSDGLINVCTLKYDK